MTEDLDGVLVVDPETFDTVPELRRELHAANRRLREYAVTLQMQNVAGNELAGFVNRALMQHLRGDHRGVAAILDEQLEASPRLREKLEEANEFCEIRQAMQWAEAAKQQSESPSAYNCEGEDPWSKKTVQELRHALDIANRTGVRVTAESVALRGVLESMSREVSTIVVAHIKGDRDAVSEAVADFCGKRVVVTGDESRKVH